MHIVKETEWWYSVAIPFNRHGTVLGMCLPLCVMISGVASGLAVPWVAPVWRSALQHATRLEQRVQARSSL